MDNQNALLYRLLADIELNDRAGVLACLNDLKKRFETEPVENWPLVTRLGSGQLAITENVYSYQSKDYVDRVNRAIRENRLP